MCSLDKTVLSKHRDKSHEIRLKKNIRNQLDILSTNTNQITTIHVFKDLKILSACLLLKYMLKRT